MVGPQPPRMCRISQCTPRVPSAAHRAEHLHAPRRPAMRMQRVCRLLHDAKHGDRPKQERLQPIQHHRGRLKPAILRGHGGVKDPRFRHLEHRPSKRAERMVTTQLGQHASRHDCRRQQQASKEPQRLAEARQNKRASHRKHARHARERRARTPRPPRIPRYAPRWPRKHQTP